MGLWHSVYYWPSIADSWQSTSVRFQSNEETGNIAVFAAGAVCVALMLLTLFLYQSCFVFIELYGTGRNIKQFKTIGEGRVIGGICAQPKNRETNIFPGNYHVKFWQFRANIMYNSGILLIFRTNIT